MEWKNSPTIIDKFPLGIHYVMGIDETGTANHIGIQRKLQKEQQIDYNDKHFTLSGVVIDRENHKKLLLDSRKLKNKYWTNGKHLYKGHEKMICFHSREIRKREVPFNLERSMYESFLNELTYMITQQDIKILSTTIDR